MHLTDLAITLPVDEEAIFVDFEGAVLFEFCVVLLFCPAIEDSTLGEKERKICYKEFVGVMFNKLLVVRFICT